MTPLPGFFGANTTGLWFTVDAGFLRGLWRVITATLLRGYADRMADLEVETVDDTGHWIVEQRPELLLARLRASLRAF
jgi:pimeloyl-ACP methyl ester carboxylesterase